MRAGAVVSTDQGCLVNSPGVHCLVAALVGLSGLMWVRGLGLTEEPGWLGCLGCALVYAFKVEDGV